MDGDGNSIVDDAAWMNHFLYQPSIVHYLGLTQKFRPRELMVNHQIFIISPKKMGQHHIRHEFYWNPISFKWPNSWASFRIQIWTSHGMTSVFFSGLTFILLVRAI